MTQFLENPGSASSDSSKSAGIPPFPAFPSVSRYVPIGSVDEAMVRIGRGIDASEAIALLMGPPGTGKSLICQTLTHRFQNSHDVVVLGNGAIKDADSLLRHILHCLGEDVVADTNRDLYLALVDRVCGPDASHGGLLILVDEAQSIAAPVFEAIRMTTNIMKDGKPRVSAVLCGGPKLEDVLADPSMEAFTQRVATRCYLHPFSADETRQYVTAVIAQCDADPDRTITLEAISAVHHAGSGVPRLINQLMTQAVDVAAEVDQSMIDEAIIDKAWAMLQQLPGPMVDEPKLRPTGEAKENAVEYGELSDWDDAASDSASDGSCNDSCQTNESCCQSNLNHPKSDDITVTTPSAVWIDDDAATAETPTTQSSAAANCEQDRPCDSSENCNHQITPEAIAQIASDALPAEALFGEFEFEEDVALGSGDDKKVQVQAESAVTTDLESMLHQEIVGMTTNDATAMVFADHADANITPPSIHPEPPQMSCGTQMSQDVTPEESVYEESVCEETVCEESLCKESFCEETEVVTDHNGPAICLADELDQDPNADAFQIRLVRDDSDLLVIEDEVELCGDQKAPLMDEERDENLAPVSVDYQALMSRMRTGS